MLLSRIQVFIVAFIIIVICHLSAEKWKCQRDLGWKFPTLPIMSRIEIISLHNNDATPFVHYTDNVQNVVYRRRGRLYRLYRLY